MLPLSVLFSDDHDVMINCNLDKWASWPPTTVTSVCVQCCSAFDIDLHDYVLYRTCNCHNIYDTEASPGSADQSILGEVHLRSNIYIKDTGILCMRLISIWYHACCKQGATHNCIKLMIADRKLHV